jgi:hypothetical protein
MQGSDVSDKARPDIFGNLAEVLLSIKPVLEERLAFLRAYPPDPKMHPITSALVKAYITRVELQLAGIRDGAGGLQNEYRNHPTLTEELQEIESWIMRREPGTPRRKLTVNDEDALGNWFVGKMGLSYSQARQKIRDTRLHLSGKGAPSKRPETLNMLDARIVNRWSSTELAIRMCDCGAAKHTAHCSERIRKRIKELESALGKYGIQIPASTTPEKNAL